ncbi:hypothetical protein DCC81_02310 [Chitinophaga parva]|uniref:Secretion system C-terminal sorting domain-containing protein n=1 Tax=Chitinophaga parva TaxID=2169414 RepID=A0A2T7BKY9_9BACT|nr:hypothetical protein [Chitinophaga parva]PUZ28338.1 hypothetical protein DCC81_02310 [Chitinophaga parva]
MKRVMNTKTAILLAATLLAGTAAFAQQPLVAYNGNIFTSPVIMTMEDAPTLEMNVMQATGANLTFHINVENPQLEKVKLYLLDKSGNILHEEVLPVKAHFETRYNLDQLEDGAYKIVLSTRSRDIEHAINIITSVSRTGKVN